MRRCQGSSRRGGQRAAGQEDPGSTASGCLNQELGDEGTGFPAALQTALRAPAWVPSVLASRRTPHFSFFQLPALIPWSFPTQPMGNSVVIAVLQARAPRTPREPAPQHPGQLVSRVPESVSQRRHRAWPLSELVSRLGILPVNSGGSPDARWSAGPANSDQIQGHRGASDEAAAFQELRLRGRLLGPSWMRTASSRLLHPPSPKPFCMPSQQASVRRCPPQSPTTLGIRSCSPHVSRMKVQNVGSWQGCGAYSRRNLAGAQGWPSGTQGATGHLLES